MKRATPIIGVTGPDRGGEAAWWFTRLAITLAGGTAVRITPRRPRRIDGLDGLIIGGGADIDPRLYGDVPSPLPLEKPREQSAGLYLIDWLLAPVTYFVRKIGAQSRISRGDTARDALELRLIEAAVGRELPILGICRGAQLLNVFFGGTLHQSLAGFYIEGPEVRSILPRKQIRVEPGTRLATVLGEHPRMVNALHRQAIRDLGQDLRVAARDTNGIVQAIEHNTLPFVAGVQWHPEYLPQLREQRAIFETLVSHARPAAGSRPSGVQAQAVAG